MMTLLIGIITVLMVVDCLLLILLVLVQLPKKEAGAGLAFGGAATDALFGAGSGNALTKITKWVAGGFFVLALSLSLLKAQQARPHGSDLEEQLRKQATTQKAPAASTPAAPAPSAETPMLLTNQIAPVTPAPSDN